MTLKWEELTAPDFDKAVKQTGGVCIIPIGVLERHGDHLPLGTDTTAGYTLAERAIAKAPAILFPVVPFGQINEAKQCAGTIALKSEVLFALLKNLCDEVARNGCKKIIILNAHGGNPPMLEHFAKTTLEERKDYAVFICDLKDYLYPVIEGDEWKSIMESEFDDHGGEVETSILMAAGDNVKLEYLKDDSDGLPLERLKHMKIGYTGIKWYADYPRHYAGNAKKSTKEKGEFLLNKCSDIVAEMIEIIRKDEDTIRLQNEFFDSDYSTRA